MLQYNILPRSGPYLCNHPPCPSHCQQPCLITVLMKPWIHHQYHFSIIPPYLWITFSQQPYATVMSSSFSTSPQSSYIRRCHSSGSDSLLDPSLSHLPFAFLVVWSARSKIGRNVSLCGAFCFTQESCMRVLFSLRDILTQVCGCFFLLN